MAEKNLPDLTYEAWFKAQQGKPYEFMWDFGRDAWAAGQSTWRNPVTDHLIVCGILTADHERSAVLALKTLIDFEVDIALDPQVSQRASELIERGAQRAFRTMTSQQDTYLNQVEAAARNLVAQKGRHNTQIAYEKLVKVLKQGGQRV